MTEPAGWQAAPPPPSPSGSPRRRRARVVAILLAAIALGAIGLAVLARTSEQPDMAAPPTPVATAPTTTEPPAPTPAPTAEPTPRPDGSDVDAIADEVAAIRGLPTRRPLRSAVVTGDALADKISEIAFTDLDADEIERTRRLLVALRLAPADLDLAAVLEDLYREQVLGVYVPRERTLYVTSDGSGTSLERLTMAHEVTHALQDQSFDLHRLRERHEDDEDASLAVLSLIEGDAVVTQQLWAMRHLTPAERLEAAGGAESAGEALERAPEYLRAGLFFPYREGGLFVAELYRRGGFQAVDDAFADPPTTTEQIMEPERYRAGEDAEVVTVDGRPGAGWRPSATYEFGQFDLREMLKAHTGDDVAVAAASGWGGGQVRTWARGEDTAVGLALAFDTDDDGAEACSALREWYQAAANGRDLGGGTFRGDGDHMTLACAAGQVRLGLAPAAATTSRMAAS